MSLFKRVFSSLWIVPKTSAGNELHKALVRSLGSAWIEIIRVEFTRKDITKHPLTSSQYFRLTDLPSLRTQSSILVFMPLPQTAFSLSWHVLQSGRKGAYQNRRLCMNRISHETRMTWIPYLIHNCFLSPAINHPTRRAYGPRLWTYLESNGNAGVAHRYRDYSSGRCLPDNLAS